MDLWFWCFWVLIGILAFYFTINIKEFFIPWNYLTPADAEKYCLSVTSSHEVLKKIRKETLKRSDSMCISSDISQQLFRVILVATNAKKGVDIGVYTGLSSTAMALQMKRNSENEAEVFALEYDEKNLDIARRWWKEAKVDNVIKGVLGDAKKSLDTIFDEKGECYFDFAFVDADKTGYLAYYEKLMVLVKVGGIIAFDNTLWKGSCYNRNWLFNEYTLSFVGMFSSTIKGFLKDMKAIRKLNECIMSDDRSDRVDVVLLPIDDGITIIRRKK